MNNCIYLRQRSRRYIKYLYCAKSRSEVDYDDCRGCIYKEYKKTKPIRLNPDRERVSKETYNKVIEECNHRCALCGSENNLHLHHINGRGRGKTDNPDNCIMLCANCHLNVVHANSKKWKPILNAMKEAK